MKKRGYIKGIDGLRALAVLMVFGYHLNTPLTKSGLLGVTSFFVISGYLITGILTTEIVQTGTIDLKEFWVKRIRRLVPAVLTMIAVLIPASAIVNRVIFSKASNDLLSALFCYNNWWQIFNGVSYFENAGAPSPLTHCWSLAIEMQFYVVYPLILLLLAKVKKRKKITFFVTLVLALVSIGLMYAMYTPGQDPSRVYYGTDTRAFSLLIGAMLSLATGSYRTSRKVPRYLPDFVGFGALIALIGMMVGLDAYSPFLYRGGHVLVSVLTAMVIYTVMNPRGLLGRVLGCAPLKWIGDRSYGIYLWHFPVILLISGGKNSAWWVGVTEFVVAVILAAISYEFIETPIRHRAIGNALDILSTKPKTRKELKRKIRTRKRARLAIAETVLTAMMVILCIGFVPRKTAVTDLKAKKEKAAHVNEVLERKLKENSTAAVTTLATNAAVPTETSIADGATLTKTDSVAEMPVKKPQDVKELQLLMLGDSVPLDATDHFYELFPNGLSDCSIGRNAYMTIEAYESAVEEGWDGDGVIFASGSNDPLESSLEDLRKAIGPDKTLYLVNIRTPYETFEASNNEQMRLYASTHDKTYLIDWYGASEDHPEYFDDDDTHLLPEGGDAYAELIKDEVMKTL